MKTEPGDKGISVNERVEAITHALAIIIAFISVFVFFFKILFF